MNKPKKKSSTRTATFDDVREIALSLPDVEEVTAYGSAAFKAGKRRFAGAPVQRAGIEPRTLGVSVSFEARERLLAAQPEVYYLIPHFESYPAVLVRLSSIGRKQLREILEAAWQHAMSSQGPGRRKVSRAR